MIAGGVKKQKAVMREPVKARRESKVRRVLFAELDESLMEETTVVKDAALVDTPVPDFLVPKYLTQVLYQIAEAHTWVNGGADPVNPWPMFEKLAPSKVHEGKSVLVRTGYPLSLGRISKRMNEDGSMNSNYGRWYFGVEKKDRTGRGYIKFCSWLTDSEYYKSGKLETQVPQLLHLLTREFGKGLTSEQLEKKWLSYDARWKKVLFTVYTYCTETPITISDLAIMRLYSGEELPDEEYFQQLEQEAAKIREPQMAQEDEE